MRIILTPALFVTTVTLGMLFLVSCSAGFSIDKPTSSLAPTEPTAMARR